MIPVKIFVNGVLAATDNIDLSVVGDTQTIASAGGSVTATLVLNWDATMASGYYRGYSFAATAANQYQLYKWKWTERIYIQGSYNFDPEVVYEHDRETPTQVYDSDGYIRDSEGTLCRQWVKTEIEVYFTGGVTSYTISVSADPSAGGTVTGGGTYPLGTTCIVYPMANQGYYCVGWYENGTKVAPGSSYSFTVTGDRNLIARFHQRTNLLVNSYNRSTPVRLVYDPDSNLLVADY